MGSGPFGRLVGNAAAHRATFPNVAPAAPTATNVATRWRRRALKPHCRVRADRYRYVGIMWLRRWTRARLEAGKQELRLHLRQRRYNRPSGLVSPRHNILG